MRYFNSLPFIQTGSNNNSYFLKNLLIRTSLISQLAKNPLLFYTYSIQDGDTPEIIANKYYGDPYRYWIVLIGNPQIKDLRTDWPLTSNQFADYINDKYGVLATAANQTALQYTQTTTHHYEKVVTSIDNTTQTTAIKVVEVDQDTYNSIPLNTNKRVFSNGSSVNYTLSRNTVSIYDYENKLNESKRNINLINSIYISQVETQYQALVSA
jgi:hypothetical protein